MDQKESYLLRYTFDEIMKLYSHGKFYYRVSDNYRIEIPAFFKNADEPEVFTFGILSEDREILTRDYYLAEIMQEEPIIGGVYFNRNNGRYEFFDNEGRHLLELDYESNDTTLSVDLIC
ncbi:MAG TPA: hypothetical protein VHA74_02300 [Candidatus Dojkabacteria bacterium]|nr:hypothetical protein [Candidatus Dojkabacteria bacterium]